MNRNNQLFLQIHLTFAVFPWIKVKSIKRALTTTIEAMCWTIDRKDPLNRNLETLPPS